MNKAIFWIIILSILIVFLLRISEVITPFFIAFIIAYLLEPPIHLFHKKYKIPRTIAVYGVFVLFLGSLVVLFITILPIIYNQIALLVGKIPIYKEYIQIKIIPVLTNKISQIDGNIANELQEAIQGFANHAISLIFGLVQNIWQYTIATISLFVIILLVPIILIYLLRDWSKLIFNARELLPLSGKNQINTLFSDINQLISAYIRGQLNICFVLIIFYCIGLSIIGIDFWLLIGIASGILIILPIIGTILSVSVAMTIGYFTFGYSVDLLYIIGLYVIGHIIESYFITPKIIGSKIGLHPLWIMFSVFTCGDLFGFVGIFFAIPIAGIIKVLLGYGIDIYKSSTMYR